MLLRLELNRQDPRVRRDLSDVHELHRSVWSMFGRCLWAVDRRRAVLTVRRSSGVGVTLTPGYVKTAKCIVEDYSILKPDDVLGFRLTATPTKKQDGRRVPADPTGWLHRKAPEFGCEVLGIKSIARETVHGRRQGALLTFVSVTYAGWLRIRDTDRLIHGLIRGVGPAKGYGHGLLLLDMRGI